VVISPPVAGVVACECNAAAAWCEVTEHAAVASNITLMRTGPAPTGLPSSVPSLPRASPRPRELRKTGKALGSDFFSDGKTESYENRQRVAPQRIVDPEGAVVAVNDPPTSKASSTDATLLLEELLMLSPGRTLSIAIALSSRFHRAVAPAVQIGEIRTLGLTSRRGRSPSAPTVSGRVTSDRIAA
jgi:hypothetical protein